MQVKTATAAMLCSANTERAMCFEEKQVPTLLRLLRLLSIGRRGRRIVLLLLGCSSVLDRLLRRLVLLRSRRRLVRLQSGCRLIALWRRRCLVGLWRGRCLVRLRCGRLRRCARHPNLFARPFGARCDTAGQSMACKDSPGCA